MAEESNNQQLKELLEMNLRETEEIKQEIVGIKIYLRVRAIVAVLWMIIVLAPTIFAIFYIPSLIKDLANSNSLFNLLGM